MKYSGTVGRVIVYALSALAIAGCEEKRPSPRMEIVRQVVPRLPPKEAIDYLSLEFSDACDENLRSLKEGRWSNAAQASQDLSNIVEAREKINSASGCLDNLRWVCDREYKPHGAKLQRDYGNGKVGDPVPMTRGEVSEHYPLCYHNNRGKIKTPQTLHRKEERFNARRSSRARF